MRKNKTMRVATLLLALTLITSCFVGGTFAKYTANVSGSDTARVAKFEVSAFGTTATTTTNTATVNVFNESAVYDTNGVTDYTAAGTVDADIATGSGTAIIAPGSWGTFSFDLVNKSEVTVQYAIDYTITGANVPLMWSTDGKTWANELTDVTSTTLAMDTDDTDNVDGTTETVKVYWKWDFEGTGTTADADDTALGIAGTASPSVKIDVTFTQVD